MNTLGLALSGGGSRAAAFHCGTLEALMELEIDRRIDVVSTVSGGSLFGAAWMAAMADGRATSEFIVEMRTELERGFVRRSLRPAALLALTPGVPYSRTHLLADTFERIFFHGMSLGSLPTRPALCVNTTILNSGQVGKFSREGFSAWGISVPDSQPAHMVPWTTFPVARAVAASAAFPIGLPPLTLRASDLPEGSRLSGALTGARAIHLTDGGVLENLGVQTLIKSQRFSCWDLIVSDAGTWEEPWRDRGILGSLRGLGVWLLGGRILDRLLTIMNDKQNRWARQKIYDEVVRTWLSASVHSPEDHPGIRDYIGDEAHRRRRSLLFVRVAQDWNSFVRAIPRWRLIELGIREGRTADSVPSSGSVDQIGQFLEDVSCDLTRARECYADLGGDETAAAMNQVKTGFTGLPRSTLTKLGRHAAWQVHAAHAVFSDSE